MTNRYLNKKIFQVENALGRVRNEWSMRSDWLAQVREWHAFQREAKQTLGAIAARQSTLRCAEVWSILNYFMKCVIVNWLSTL